MFHPWSMSRAQRPLGNGTDEPATDRTTAISTLRDLLQARAKPEGGRTTLPVGIDAIDARMPLEGLALGALHEIAPESTTDGPAALGFALALVARHLARGAGEAMLVLGRGYPAPYGDGLSDLGLDPGRLLLIEVENDTDAYRAMEESLSARGLRAVAGLIETGLPVIQSRRLHLAAGRSDRLLLVLRPAGAESANVAVTRWRIGAAPALRDRFGGLVRPRWRASLDRCRNGRTGFWLLEWDHAAHRFDLAGALADHAAETRGTRLT
ncbi:ImuA protein [Methylobacterium sp. Leaf466]|uniref:ImuA family protein n=1 Tax=Methylobacterium sp. Leaf466 TaxID=1736386 RepID=UPI001FCDD1BA|nr:ImuA protein [Methylobacterium sp. Leaf466]